VRLVVIPSVRKVDDGTGCVIHSIVESADGASELRRTLAQELFSSKKEASGKSHPVCTGLLTKIVYIPRGILS
jgi:hypothetical protein